jgi:hypothetical protein
MYTHMHSTARKAVLLAYCSPLIPLENPQPTHPSHPQYSIFSSTNNGPKKPNKNTQEKKWILKRKTLTKTLTYEFVIWV